MRPVALPLLLLLLLADAITASPRPAVVGYLPEWRYNAFSYNATCQHLTHLIFFSVEPLPNGSLTGLDRLPGAEALASAYAGRRSFGTKLLLSLGGNGRSSGFSAAARDKATRKRLVAAVVALLARLQLDGVDYNWEYPGFAFGGGYMSDSEVSRDWDALRDLVGDTKSALAPSAGLVTLAYYPDGRQETYLAARQLCGTPHGAELCHAMSYDAPGLHHSPLSLARTALAAARSAGFVRAMTLGVPLYGRHTVTGEWTTWEVLVQKVKNNSADVDAFLPDADGRGAGISFNGPASMRAKVDAALGGGAAGVMLWESGQDCRAEAVVRDGQRHEVTCPEVIPLAQASLHAAISAAVATFGSRRDGVVVDGADGELRR